MLDWTQWAGEIAFGVVVKYCASPYAVFGAKVLRGMLISTIVAYRDGKTPEQWLSDQLKVFAKAVEGKLVDPENFAKLPRSSQAKGWAIFVAYNLFKEYFYNGKTFYQAISDAGWSVTSEALGNWLSDEVKARRPT